MEMKRRDLAKGALWSAPVLVASTQVPLYAASQETCTQLKFGDVFTGSTGTSNPGFPSRYITDQSGKIVGQVTAEGVGSRAWMSLGGDRWARGIDGATEIGIAAQRQDNFSRQNLGLISPSDPLGSNPLLAGSLFTNMAAPYGEGQRITFRFFDKSYSKISFRIHDADDWNNNGRYGYRDNVSMTANKSTFKVSGNGIQTQVSALSGGTTGSIAPYQQNSHLNYSAAQLQTDVSIEGAVSSYTLTYTNGMPNAPMRITQGILITAPEVCE